MAGRPALAPYARNARNRFQQATSGKSALTSPTALTIATQITATAPFGFSNSKQGPASESGRRRGHHNAHARHEQQQAEPAKGAERNRAAFCRYRRRASVGAVPRRGWIRRNAIPFSLWRRRPAFSVIEHRRKNGRQDRRIAIAA